MNVPHASSSCLFLWALKYNKYVTVRILVHFLAFPFGPFKVLKHISTIKTAVTWTRSLLACASCC